MDGAGRLAGGARETERVELGLGHRGVPPGRDRPSGRRSAPRRPKGRSARDRVRDDGIGVPDETGHTPPARRPVEPARRGQESGREVRVGLSRRGDRRAVQDGAASQFHFEPSPLGVEGLAAARGRGRSPGRRRVAGRPSSGRQGVGSTRLAADDAGRAGTRRGRSSRRRRPSRSRGGRSPEFMTAPLVRLGSSAGCAPGPLRRACRPAPDWTWASWPATRWRTRAGCSAGHCARHAPHRAPAPRSTSSSSCSFERTFNAGEAAEEVREVVDGRVAEDARAGWPSSPVPAMRSRIVRRHQPGELVDERPLGQLHGLLEAGGDLASPLGLVEPRRGSWHQVVGRRIRR